VDPVWGRKVLRAFEKAREAVAQRTGVRLFSRFDIRPFIGEGPAYNIKTSVGCLGRCTYCAVRFAKGRINSYPIDRIYEEFRRGLAKGFRRFVLAGDDLGCYGRDLGTDLVALLEKLLSIDGDYEFVLRDLEPRFFIEMFDGLKKAFNGRKIYSFSSPVQSGSDRVLKRMGRDYQIGDFMRCVRWMNEFAPWVKVRTAIMVGFPGEDEADFKKSLDLLDQARFDLVDVYSFSKRPRTEAERMSGQISDFIKWGRGLKAKYEVWRKVLRPALWPVFEKVAPRSLLR